jgi:CubicO group peptidase (beta-lactamase class C family)
VRSKGFLLAAVPRPHLLYSLTKSVTSIAVGLAIADGLFSLDDRVVDVLPDHVPADISEQGRQISVHHLLSMTAGHRTDTLAEAWQLEPGDLVNERARRDSNPQPSDP